jgi:FG-GAP-like repeat/Bacterial Ig-like domain (group 3)/Abnormal spindle-like microcephaly-assoc'd, ASPM-SPD-2-Hydin/FG-GAP repeat
MLSIFPSFFSTKPAVFFSRILNSAGWRNRLNRSLLFSFFWCLFAFVATLLSSAQIHAAATTNTLTVTANGSAVTTTSQGTLVTLTATVTAAGAPVIRGQVNFCDATAKLCSDIHLFGTAQLTSTGTATIKFVPGPGTHSYKAVFPGTTANAGSASVASSLTVTAASMVASTTTITSSGSPGNYTLTALVTGEGSLAPSGTLSFLDTSNSNYLLATAPLIPQVASGTLSFLNSSNPVTNRYPQSVVVADFNDDGKLDLAVPVYSLPGLDIFLGNGDGTFQAAPPVGAISSNVGFAAVADFNGDGKPDIAVTNDGNIMVLLGNGDGTFTGPTQVPVTNVFGIATADLNGDGIPDLVGTSGFSLTVMLGKGDGTFTVDSPMATTGNTSSVAIGDLNGDGIPDLATTFYSGFVEIFLGKGDGAFTPVTSEPAVGYSPSDIVAGDLNGDGILDLAVANLNPNNINSPATVTVLLGKGDGTFTTSTLTLLTNSLPYSVAIGDFNGDGIPDLATANAGKNTATVFLGNGDGTFTTGPGPSLGTNPIFAAVGDFNGDGLSDIAGALNGPNFQVTVLLAQDSEAQTASATASGISVVGTGTHLVDASYAGDGNYQPSTSGTVPLTVNQATPAISWGTPAAILYGTALDATQLDATAPTGGSFAYSPSAGTVLSVGSHTLTVTFTPTDTTNYTTATASVTLMVNAATPTISWTTPAAITYGTALSGTQLNATATDPTTNIPVAGTFIYNPLAGTVLPVGTVNLEVNFTPTDTATYSTQTATVTVTVNKAEPAITWATPAAISYGTQLSGTQLNATSTVPGSYVYSPVAGAVLGTGSQILSVTFNPTDTTDYTSATGTVKILLNKTTPTVTWPTAIAITNGQTLASSTLSGGSAISPITSAAVAGSFAFTTPSTAPTATAPQSVTFTPTDTTDYESVTGTVSIQVNKAIPTVTKWPTASAITNGQTLASAALSGGEESVAGTFAFTTPSTVPPAGNALQSLTFTPTNSGYTTVNGTVSVQVNKATPIVTWPTAIAITSSQTLASSNLNGGSAVSPITGAGVPGSFAFTAPTTKPTITGLQSVTFTPADTADYATVTGSVTVTVKEGGGPVATVSPTVIDFGTLYLGSVVTKTVLVTNTGTAAMTISNPPIAIVGGGNSKEFISLNRCPRSLAPGKSCTMTVTFVSRPFYMQQTATLTIDDNAPGSPQTVALTAKVIDPRAHPSTWRLEFGTVKVGMSFMQSVILFNPGGTALTINSIAIAGANPDDFSETNNCTSSLQPKHSCTINVTITPTEKKLRFASLVISDNAQYGPQRILLSGAGHFKRE